jgi:transcriptional regulator with XRE-family HTH domain
MTWRFLGLAERLVQFRRTQQITSVEIARKAGISPQTLHLIEKGKVMPSMETLERIAKATKLDPGWLGFGVSANGQAPHITVVPGFECDSLVTDLLAILRGKTGVVDDVYKYLDSTGAHEWRALLRQPEFSAVVASFPMQELIDFLAETVAVDEAVDLVGLGCGTAEREMTVIKKLLARRRRNLRLLLLDISVNLLSSAVQASDEFSRAHAVPVMALLGNFHNLPEYAHLLTGDYPRRRIITMFGFTFSNLDNEVQFLRRSMGWVNHGDILVLDVPAAATDSSNPDEIVRRDKTLARKRAVEWQSAAYRFLTGPLRRNLDLIANIKIDTVLDQASCVIPGSYAIMNNTRVQLQSGDVKQFVTGYSKRYDLAKLAAHMQGEGWKYLSGFRYGPDNFGLVAIFQREQPRKRRGATTK